jgi:hypothetical protein
MYYGFSRSATTNGTGNTCSAHVRLLTVANQQVCSVVQLMASVRNSTTAGSGFLQIRKYTVGPTSVGGTALAATPQNPTSAAAATTPFSDATAFTSFPNSADTALTRIGSIGFAQTGGQGGWVALERDNAWALLPNAGANGNLELASFSATASQALEVSGQFLEG